MISKHLPLVIFDGNCQGQHLAAILTASNIAECYFVGQDLGFLPSHLGEACRLTDAGGAKALIADAKANGRLTIQGTQTTLKSDGSVAGYTPLVDIVLRFPHLQLYAPSRSETEASFGSKATPRRMFEMDISVMESCQKRAGYSLDIAGFVREESRSRPLFHTAVHPSGAVMAMLVEDFARQIPNADLSTIKMMVQYLKLAEGINSTTYHPAAHDVLDELGFAWGSDYAIYTQMMTHRAAGDWKAIIANQDLYIEKFGGDSYCWLSLAQAHLESGSLTFSELCSSRLLDLSPGYMHFWLLAARILLNANKRDEVDGLVHRASCFFKGQRIFSQLMAYLSLTFGDLIQAEYYSRDYHARTPDRADALIPLLKTLWQLRKHSEIEQIVAFVISNHDRGQLSEIRQNLAGSPELAPFERRVALAMNG